jgi:hypothetical protein
VQQTWFSRHPCSELDQAFTLWFRSSHLPQVAHQLSGILEVEFSGNQCSCYSLVDFRYGARQEYGLVLWLAEDEHCQH